MGAGRPRLKQGVPSERITVTLDRDLLAFISREAKLCAKPKAEIIRRYLFESIGKWSKRHADKTGSD